jgi:hypothetical protein
VPNDSKSALRSASLVLRAIFRTNNFMMLCLWDV